MGVLCPCGESRNNNEMVISAKKEDDAANLKANENLNVAKTSTFNNETADANLPDQDLVITNDLIVAKCQGTPLERYEIVKSLGEGSFGKVYLVRHRDSKMIRAMKEIAKDDSNKEEDILNEMEILKRLDHPNIVKIYEFFEFKNKYYFITEFCQMGELFDEINKIHKFKEDHAASIMYQLLLSVYYCHINNVIHRDLKPENILLESKDEKGHYIIKVIDFGTAKIFKPNEKERKLIGSAFYIAPEVIKKSYNEKCDLWSCGVILYILLTGMPPFNGNTDSEVFQAIANKNYDTRRLANFSQEAVDLISKLLTRDVEQRISANDALSHPFFKLHKVRENSNNLIDNKVSVFINNLKTYKADYKLQQAAIAIIVHNLPRGSEIKDLERAFRFMDDNHDGRLTKKELEIGLIKILNKPAEEAKEEVEKIFKKADGDMNGYLEYEEFIRACIQRDTLLRDDYLKLAFDFFDKDSSGLITTSEIKEVFSGGNTQINDKTIQNLINEADVDGDGQISFEEFKKMMKSVI